MEAAFESEKIILLLDNFGPESQKLYESFKTLGKAYPVFVIEDDGFLPEGVTSVYGYLLGEFAKSELVPGRPRFFNQIKVPEYWEITGTNSNGKIHDMHRERGRIFYAEPKHNRMVKVVDWYDDRGIVRSSDHYNKYGALYARTAFNAKGQRINKSYFNAHGQEILMENYVTKDIIFNDGNCVKIFRGKKELTAYVITKAGYAFHRIFFNTLSTSFFVSELLPENGKGDVLFWQEKIKEEIPGNMRGIINGTAKRASKIMVQRKDSYEKMTNFGVSEETMQRLGYIYTFEKDNKGRAEVLICTNSDRIEKLTEITEALPEVHFSVAALTEMSSNLMQMEKHNNISLYPNVKMNILKELFQNADFYLDINYGDEIMLAVESAFLHNQLILAFKETLHNARYVPAEHVFPKDRADYMIAGLKAVLSNKELLEGRLEIQRRYAMAERKETYLNL